MNIVNVTIKLTMSVILFCLTLTPIKAQPQANNPAAKIRAIADLGTGNVRIKYDSVSHSLYLLENDGDIKKVIFGNDSSVTFSTLYTSADHGLTGTSILGMAFDRLGAIYIVANLADPQNAPTGIVKIMKGSPVTPGSDERTWSLVAQTVEYNYGNAYNHKMSGIIATPDGKYIYVNSGARTDHGEMRQGMRDVGLTSIILKLPTDTTGILLQDDREWLRSNGYLFAEGIRNDFDFAYGPDGNLFSVGNSGDRSDPEELNWLREGHHYGFPWRIGGNNTPQQYTPYDPHTDPLLSPTAWGGGQGQLYITFSNDTSYPPRPEGVVFTEPIMNSGPDADKFKDTTTGEVKDASDLGLMITTFSPHRSPNGIAFDRDSVLSEEFSGGAFVISFSKNSVLTELGDPGEDLLHVQLIKTDTGYTAAVHKLVSGFNSPLGIEVVGNKIYVAETSLGGNSSPKLWEVTLPYKKTTDVADAGSIPFKFILNQNYPNPFNPVTNIRFSIPQKDFVSLKVYNILGKEVAVLIDGEKEAGEYNTEFNAAALSSGVYFAKLQSGGKQQVIKLTLLK